MTLWRGGVRPYDQGRTDLAAASHPIQVGIGHAGCTVSVQEADTTFRVYHGGRLLTEVLRTTTKQIARFKARKPGPPRQRIRRAASSEAAVFASMSVCRKILTRLSDRSAAVRREGGSIDDRVGLQLHLTTTAKHEGN